MKFFAQKNVGVLSGLGLYTEEYRHIIEKGSGISEWVTYTDNNDMTLQVSINKRKGRYFAILCGDSLCGIEDKQAFIKSAVEFAIKEGEFPVSFEEMGVGGIVADEGRLAIFSKIKGELPPAAHAYAAFKMPGETSVCIEDPRTGILDSTEKLQSRFDDQVCCFAAASIFFSCANAWKSGDTRSTSELFTGVYNNSKLRAYIQELENKVGISRETKDQVIASFIKLLTPQNSLFKINDKENDIPLEESQDVTRLALDY